MGGVIVDAPGSGRRRLESNKYVEEGMIIREVELKTVANVMCERRLQYLSSASDVGRALFIQETYLRAIFVDKYSCLSVTWVPTTTRRRDAQPREWIPLWCLIILPARFRRRMQVERWTRQMSLRESSRLAPDPPFLLATAAMFTRTNFEVFVDEPSHSNLIWRICDEVRAMFARGRVRGRMELRFGKNIQFLDFDILSGNTDVVFETLRRIYGCNVPMRLHKGKAQVTIPATVDAS